MSKGDPILKRIEISLRQKLVRFLSYKGETKVIESPVNVFEFASNPKILLLRQDRIGDVLISTPFIRILREKFPQAQIDIVLGRHNIGANSIVQNRIDNVIEYQKGFGGLISTVRSIRKNNYDIVIDLLDNSSTTSSILIKFSKSRYKLGLGKENSYVYSYIVPRPSKREVHVVERMAELLKPFGIDPDSQNLSLDYEVEESNKNEAIAVLKLDNNKFNIALNMAGSSSSKYWGKTNFVELIQLLNSNYSGVNAYLFGTQEYVEDMRYISNNCEVIVAPESLSFEEYAAKISNFDMIFTPDTAAVHLASAFKIPCLAIYDTSDIYNNGMNWEPYGIESEIVITDSGKLSDIKPSECFEAFEKLYSRLRSE